MTSDTRLPRPELRGVGKVMYRCAKCGELMEPERAVVMGGKSYHPDHVPETEDNGR